jgi:hypothetical protein
MFLHDASVATGARRSRGREVRLAWSANLAYAVGLVATDGCLLSTGRHVAFVSKDLEQIQNFLLCIGRPGATVREDGTAFRVYFGDVELYDWLTAAGLTPRKSLTLAGLEVPDEFFLDAVRGLLDGDGSIAHYVHEPNRADYPGYRYRRLCVRFYSASQDHLSWLQTRLRTAIGIRGALIRRPRELKHDMFALQYAKYASTLLLGKLYEDPDSPRLRRKWLIWEDFRSRPVTTRPYIRRKALAD